MSAGRVLVVGSLNADLTVRTDRFPQPGETLTGSELVIAAGGKSANQAAAAAVLGADVVLLGAAGADGHGDLLLAAAGKAGVDVSAVLRRTGTATGTAMIVVDGSAENTIIISPGANATLAPGDVGPEHFTGVAVLCLCLEIPLQTVLAAARAGHRAGAQVVLNLSPYRHVPQELLELTDLLLVNAHEAAQVLGVGALDAPESDTPGSAAPELDTPDWAGMLEGFAALGIARAIITLGGDGAVVLDSSVPGHQRVHRVDPTRIEVVDTTGCGDAFTAAVAHHLAAGFPLVDAARFAARAGALAATRPGAQSSYAALRGLAG